MIPTNLLQLPTDSCGFATIKVTDAMCENLKDLPIVYDPTAKKFSISKTSDISRKVMYDMLYRVSMRPAYLAWKWYPILEKDRNVSGNFVFTFTWRVPDEAPRILAVEDAKLRDDLRGKAVPARGIDIDTTVDPFVEPFIRVRFGVVEKIVLKPKRNEDRSWS